MMTEHDMQNPDSTEASAGEQRRTFLRGLGKWSQAVIGGALLGGALATSPSAQAGGWINRRGGWGGGGWVNRGGGAGWINGGGWVNGGGSWINGGGGGWINRRGGGGVGWINRR